MAAFWFVGRCSVAKFTDVTEDPTVSITRAKITATAIALKMEAVRASEMLVNSYKSRRPYNPEDGQFICIFYLCCW
jgi:hypothetical protein